MSPRSLLLLLMLIAPGYTLAQPRVVASILPIHALSSALMQGVGAPELLIPAQASPHDWTLRPSQRRSLEHADLILWVDSSLEGFMPRLLQGLPDAVQALQLSALPGLVPAMEEGHDHGETGIDPHLWLDPRMAAVLARGIADRLMAIDTAHAEVYRRNLNALLEDIARLDGELAQAMTPLKSIPFIVYHDAYGYFVRRYGLRQVAAVTETAHRQAGGRHLRELRARLLEEDIACLFTEPQFQPAIVANLIAGTETRVAELDPIGATLKPGDEAYFRLMRGIGAALTACLSVRPPDAGVPVRPDP